MINWARLAVALTCAGAIALSMVGPVLAFAVPLARSQAQVWVEGRRIDFARLAVAYGDPVAPVDDPGLRAMLAAVAARSSWQPGTRFVAITRADGKLVTFTLGSNAVSVDGTPSPMPFAPFNVGTQMYLPLLPLARALDLAVRGFHAGYVLVPQIVAVAPRHDGQRLIVRITASAPLAWRSSIRASGKQRTLTFDFPGFGTDATGARTIKSALAATTTVTQSGPPGFPTTSVAIAVSRDAKFVARRAGAGADVDIVIARSDAALRLSQGDSTPAAVRVGVRPSDEKAAPTSSPSPSAPPPLSSPPPSPAGEPTDVATAEPLGPGPRSSQSPATLPSPPMQEQKITDVAVAETPTGTRITLTLSGPVSFEWHRLADPDDRYWLDIERTLLVGPAQSLASKLPFIKEIKISQHLLVPTTVVRLSIVPTQAIDVRVGPIQNAPNQLGIEIENQPPAPDAPTAGIGSMIAAVSAAPVPSITPAPPQPTLIVLDPGHGGTDPGSLNPAYGLTESNLTLAIAHRVAGDLKRLGWRVVLTRDGDYDVGDPQGPDKEELQARCDVANAAGARLFVSIHINSSVSSAPNGATTYYWHTADRAFADAVQNDMIAAMGIADDGVKRNNFYVIHHTVMPSILIEAAYLSNPHDATLLAQPSFLDKIAAGIARGIGDFTGGPLTPVGQRR